MHFYMFHPAKFNFETKHLSRLERAIYREMIDDYMANESPFIADNQKLGWRFECNTEEERNALGTILDNFFVIKKDKKGTEYYHHKRLDAEIRAYRWGNKENFGTQDGTDKGTLAERNGTPSGTDKERKERYNKERKHMINSLREIGLTIDSKASMACLRELYAANSDKFSFQSNGIGTDTGQNGTAENGTEHQNFDVEPLPVTSNHKPNTKNKYVSEAAEVFEFWKSVFNKSDTTIFSDKRKSKVFKRLEEGYTVEQIKQAIYNCSQSEYHVSNNYTDLELICRDVEKIDRFLGLTQQIQQVNNHANHQPSYQPLDTGTTYGYASKLTADAQAYYAQQAAQQRTDGSNPIDVHCVEGAF